MACLHNLKVKKVSFVRRGANRREFFLAKSADFDTKGSQSTTSKQEAHHMRPEVRLKLGEILKAERDVERVCVLLKEDVSLKLADTELAEVRDFVSILPPSQTSEIDKMKEDLKKAEAEKVAKDAELTKIRNEQHRAEVKKWVETECQHMSGMSADEATDAILAAEQTGTATAKVLKDSFKRESEAMKASALVKEIGKSGDDYDPVGGNVVQEVAKVSSELKKSGSMKGSEAVAAAIRNIGSSRYETYRKEFNRRARTY